MDRVVSSSIRSERAQTILMGAFAVTGLLLAVIGIYGVMAQLVVVRVPEIGVRMTLGARPGQLLRQLLAEGFWQTAIGLVDRPRRRRVPHEARANAAVPDDAPGIR